VTSSTNIIAHTLLDNKTLWADMYMNFYAWWSHWASGRASQLLDTIGRTWDEGMRQDKVSEFLMHRMDKLSARHPEATQAATWANDEGMFNRDYSAYRLYVYTAFANYLRNDLRNSRRQNTLAIQAQMEHNALHGNTMENDMSKHALSIKSEIALAVLTEYLGTIAADEQLTVTSILTRESSPWEDTGMQRRTFYRRRAKHLKNVQALIQARGN